jgi:hypothetical protein
MKEQAGRATAASQKAPAPTASVKTPADTPGADLNITHGQPTEIPYV